MKDCYFTRSIIPWLFLLNRTNKLAKSFSLNDFQLELDLHYYLYPLSTNLKYWIFPVCIFSLFMCIYFLNQNATLNRPIVTLNEFASYKYILQFEPNHYFLN